MTTSELDLWVKFIAFLHPAVGLHCLVLTELFELTKTACSLLLIGPYDCTVTSCMSCTCLFSLTHKLLMTLPIICPQFKFPVLRTPPG